MNKLFFCGFCLISISCFAQIKLGVQAGYNSVDFWQYGKKPGNDFGNQYSPISAFHAGVLSEINLGKNWFLDPALLYYGNGAHDVYTILTPVGASTYNTIIRLFYIRLPVDIIYKMKLVKQVYVLAGVGLYIARGLSGTEKGYVIGYSGLGGSIGSGNSYFSISPKFKPFDFGYTILLGIEWKNFRIMRGLSNGITQLYSQPGYNVWNSAFSVSLSYLIKI